MHSAVGECFERSDWLDSPVTPCFEKILFSLRVSCFALVDYDTVMAERIYGFPFEDFRRILHARVLAVILPSRNGIYCYTVIF